MGGDRVWGIKLRLSYMRSEPFLSLLCSLPAIWVLVLALKPMPIPMPQNESYRIATAAARL